MVIIETDLVFCPRQPVITTIPGKLNYVIRYEYRQLGVIVHCPYADHKNTMLGDVKAIHHCSHLDSRLNYN